MRKAALLAAYGWLPSDLPGLQFWVWADDLSRLFQANNTATSASSGSTVGRWVDRVNGWAFDQATESLRPTWNPTAINGRPGVTFSANDSVLSYAIADAFGDHDQGTFYAVAKPSQEVSDGAIFSTSDEAGTTNYLTMFTQKANSFHWENIGMTLTGGPNETYLDGQAAVNAGDVQVLEVGTTGDGAWYSTVNGADDATGSATGGTVGAWFAALNDGAAGRDNLNIGARKRNTTTLEFKGSIGAILYFSPSLSAGNRALVRQFLAGHYGVMLAQ